ncbi:MAG: glycosyltransferase, partial [Vicinamibacterales bacterium]|nr:glycosyltransferase [Vicinamibacterales bacterium]
ADPRLEHLTLDYRGLPDASHPDNLLIHHFSIGSRASRVAYALPDRMALVYHNITPPEYFIGVHPLLVQLCFMGRRELRAYVGRVAMALGDSEYNRQELAAAGFTDTAVLPVVPSFAHLDVPPSRLLSAPFDDAWVNLLFVGRVIPNKKLEDVIRVFAAYKRTINPRSRLIFVGSHAGFDLYFAMLQQLVATLRLPDVHFMGHVSNEELTSFYDIADVFLCASEHEGFCVPLIEAFYKRVPVVAYAATAVPATMDGGGVLFEDKDPAHVARIVDALVSDQALAERVIEAQDAALDRLVGRDFGATLLRFVERIAAMPATPHPGVAFDFWDQYARMDALEELRVYRPAAFDALPRAAPGADSGGGGPVAGPGPGADGDGDRGRR